MILGVTIAWINVWSLPTVKPTRCTNFSIFFLNETLHVSDSSSVHHQEFFTVHTTMVYVIQVCWRLTNRMKTEPVASWSCSQAAWHIPLLCVQWKTPDDGHKNCPKHVEFYSKNKFEKLMYLVGFVIRFLSRCTVTWISKNVWSKGMECALVLCVPISGESYLSRYKDYSTARMVQELGFGPREG